MERLMAASQGQGFENYVVVTSGGGSAIGRDARALGIPCEEIARWDWPGLVGILRRIHPDVAYLFGTVRTIPWTIAARAAGIPCVVVGVRSSASTWKDHTTRRIEAALCDGFIANSRIAARRLVERHGVPDRRVFVVYNGLDERQKPVSDAPSSLFGKPTVVCVGTLTPNKGQMYLLEAVGRLRKRYPHLRALLLGRDETRGRFLRQAEQNGYGPLFSWVGHVDDVRGYLAKSTVLALPTTTREGTPTAILEAMAAGLPVVATRVGGVSELVQDGVTGFLVEPRDSRCLASALTRVFDNEELRVRVASQGRRYVATHHSMSEMVARHRDVFLELASRRISTLPRPAGPSEYPPAAAVAGCNQTFPDRHGTINGTGGPDRRSPPDSDVVPRS